MKIAIIGQGAIGRYVMDGMYKRGLTPHALIVRGARLNEGDQDGVLRVADADDLPADTTHVIDCAGHAGLRAHGPKILQRGMVLVTVSVGALADDMLHTALTTAARTGGAQLRLASGAIGALDALRAAKVGGLDEVTYIGRKPPAGWQGSPAEAKVNLDTLKDVATHFDGTARNAALEYPKNANVAAAVALAGTGFDDTRVKLIADPAVTGNTHEIQAKGAFGQFAFQITGRALPDNPRSSALAAMSVIAEIDREQAKITT